MTASNTSKKFIAFIDQFAKLDQEMQIQQIAVFLLVMGKPGITMKELARETGLASSSVSRNVAAMSNLVVKGKLGHGLIDAYEDPEDRRSKLCRPTAKGTKVFNILSQIFR
ncbi:helix-turn-helix domain-containing protein [Mesorhizobium sp. M00.F.Ca.ET.216.01.1.1]|uniref:MarR family winged helix-turn-helix transcriptional regulator n=1 Tax=Mesorhizobium sp. M00.F.Ca.ET.216.01.1.1 TaxID=2500528 RepID=UPI000FD98E77|nr:helix-turn-helix domain-containing protein [Mesorhizobium sp. M00.F.Ca.ET.216.01.1.1]TGQ31847.1 MarR family transcriptional regulator [Mesorhizobium sp. M00.F.Ca.ET.216.01.1.1]